MRIQKGGLFSAGTPGLDEAAHAFIGYCSSDSWLGNSSQLWRGRAFYFQGSEILVETVRWPAKRGQELSILAGQNPLPFDRASQYTVRMLYCWVLNLDLLTRLNDWFQFDHLAKSYHSIFLTSGPDGGPASRQDLEVIAALRSGFRETLAQWVDAAEENRARRDAPVESALHGTASAGESKTAVECGILTVFASGCFGHCITEDAQYFNIRLREGPGQGMSLNDTTAAFLSGAMNSKAFIEQCHCSTLSCSDGCAPRKLWKVMLKGLAEYVLLPLLLLCVLRRLCCSRRSVEPLLGAPGSVS
eukprot:g10402.t1